MRAALILLFCCCFAARGCFGDDQEFRLIRYLMSNYDAAVRPSHSAAHTLAVSFDLALLHIVALDERQGVLTTNCRITQRWNDVHLRWNASDFGGVSAVRIPASQVWRPDILLHNNADSDYGPGSSNWNVVLRSSGDLLWMANGVLRSSCRLDLQFFPFDTQMCHLNFTSWSYDAAQVSLSAERGRADLSFLQPNSEFHLQESWVESLGPCCGPEPRPGLGYALVLKRRPTPHLLRLVLPCFLMNALAAFSFCVPPASAERVTLAVGSLVALLLLLLSVGRLPPAQKLPLLGVYQVATLCMVASATFLSALTLGLHRKGGDGSPLPPCLKNCVLGCLARVLFVSCPRRTNLQVLEKGSPIERYTSSPQLLRRRSEAARSSDEFERRFLRVLDRVHETLERHEARDREHEGRMAASHDWSRLARVTDRLLTLLFLAGALLAAALLFAFAPL